VWPGTSITRTSGDGAVEPGQAVRVGPRAGHLRHGRLAQRLDAVDVVGVVVGDQDVGQVPAAPRQLGLDRGLVGDVDHRRRAGGRVVHQEGVVVGQAGDGDDFHAHASQVRFGGP
jgi:hypothetical protein